MTMEITLGFDAAWNWRFNAGTSARARGAALRCLAASGGSRRDMQKIVARTKHRRARHMKLLNRQDLYDPQEDLGKRPHMIEISPRDEEDDDRAVESRSAVEISTPEKHAVEEVASPADRIEDPGDNRLSEAAEDLRSSIEAAAEEILESFPGRDLSADDRASVSELKEELAQEEEAYACYKVLVAGASGRTGRIIVENLASKGASVRALLRDSGKANRFSNLDNVKVVRGDICKYETLKHGLSDSNVVICAIGSQSFPLDIISTYKVEYEGVLNLISAAKNQGNIKKFIFVTSIGVSSFFQLIPILWWKRQAEIALQRSGLDYTIVRPGGLREGAPSEERIDMRAPDSLYFGGISRSKVAEVCVEAIALPEASEKIVEIIAGNVPRRSIKELFSRI